MGLRSRLGFDFVTQRLSLHQLSYGEAITIVNGEEHHRVPWCDGFPASTTIHACRDVIDRGMDPDGLGTYVLERRIEGDLIGEFAFLRSVDDAPDLVDVAYSIVPTARGRGYAKEALAFLANWALSLDTISAVRASVTQQNNASKAVLHACGFRYVRASALDELWQRLGS